MTTVMPLWPKKRNVIEIQVAKTEARPLVKDGDTWKATKALLEECHDHFKHIEQQNTAIQVNGRGFLSTKDLEACKDAGDELWRKNKELDDYVKGLKTLATLPIPKMQRA